MEIQTIGIDLARRAEYICADPIVIFDFACNSAADHTFPAIAT
jgi:hypothetical protein